MPHDLPKAYDPAIIEDHWAEFWVREKLFAQPTPATQPANVESLCLAGPSFTILLPPPNVTGRLHMGHMLNQTEMDILVRWRRMTGRRALWLGLPACATLMLLATTNHVCQEVAVIPFLWVAPLGLYLLISLNGFKRHWTEAFSGLAIPDWKNFLRVRIDETGGLTIFPIGFRRVPRRWKPGPASPTGPRLESDDPAFTGPQLIEPPIVVPPRSAP